MKDKSLPQPWWKFGHVWLVVAGPAIVVVAGFITLYLAIRMPDPVLSPEEQRQGVKIQAARPGDLTPAELARNHASTGGPMVRPSTQH